MHAHGADDEAVELKTVEQFELMKQASCKRPSGCARSFMLPQHSHMSEVYAINTPDTRLTDEILEFVKSVK